MHVHAHAFEIIRASCIWKRQKNVAWCTRVGIPVSVRESTCCMLAVFVQRRKNVNISHIKEREHISAHTCMYRRMHTCVHIRGSRRKCLQTRVYVLCVFGHVLFNLHAGTCVFVCVCVCICVSCVRACMLVCCMSSCTYTIMSSRVLM